MKRILVWMLAIGLALPLAACGGGQADTSLGGGASAAAAGVQQAEEESGAGADALTVVTTIYAPYDFIREIAGEHVELTMLLPPGSETHSFEPTPQDMIKIQSCDLFVYVGGDSDAWVETILGSMDTEGMTILALMDLVDVVEEELVEGMQGGHSHGDEEAHGHEDEDDHDHDDEEHEEPEEHDDDHEPELDEHVWTSPKNAITIVKAFAGTLAGLDSTHAEAYEAAAAEYLARLEALDAAYQALLKDAARKVVVFGDRFPFRYLADAYGLEYYAAFPGCSTETEASAQTVAFLINKVSDEEIPVVFYIEMSNEKMADTICEATGAQKLLLHSCHNVTRDEMQQGVRYIDLMWQNLENLKTALR